MGGLFVKHNCNSQKECDSLNSACNSNTSNFSPNNVSKALMYENSHSMHISTEVDPSKCSVSENFGSSHKSTEVDSSKSSVSENFGSLHTSAEKDFKISSCITSDESDGHSKISSGLEPLSEVKFKTCDCNEKNLEKCSCTTPSYH